MKHALRRHTPAWILGSYHWLWALVGAVVHWFPSRHLTVIGVTGTNGKSTVVRMIHHLLQSSGIETAALSTIEQVLGDQRQLNPHKGTMPGRGALQQFLRRAVRSGCRVAVVEVTSEGVFQHRHRFIGWDVAVMTNVTPEHIERHGSFEAYREQKLRFFREGLAGHGSAVINADDPSAPLFVQAATGAHIVCVTMQDQISAPCKETIKATHIQDVEEGQDFFVEDHRVRLPLFGRFNISNAVTAIAVATILGVEQKEALEILPSITAIPGRMETVIKDPFRVVVDYAHTPDALEQVYAALHDPGGHDPGEQRLVCVLGAAGGGRDRWKRSEFGGIAANYCDHVILTDEDPYDEDPEAIVDEIQQGFAQSKMAQPPFEIILDRRDAIRSALQQAQKGDTVIITGKGSEQEMALARGVVTPWDDRDVVQEEFERLTNNTET